MEEEGRDFAVVIRYNMSCSGSRALLLLESVPRMVSPDVKQTNKQREQLNSLTMTKTRFVRIKFKETW